MENVHYWDSRFGKSALLSLLFSVSVLNAYGHLFSYRTYYANNFLAWEGEKRQIKWNSFSLQSLLMLCIHSYHSYSQFRHWFMLLHSMHCSDPSRWAISAQVTNRFLLCSCFSSTVYASGFCWSGSKCCLSVWLDRQTPSTSGHCGCKTGPGSPESTHSLWLFKSSLKIHVRQCC